MNDFLGLGWSVPLAFGRSGKLELVQHEDTVRQSIHTILATAPGERMMRPEFGCAIHDLIFAPATSATAGLLASEVRSALLRWEPRIELRDVTAELDADADPIRFLVNVDYRVEATNSRFNLVFPFYLE